MACIGPAVWADGLQSPACDDLADWASTIDAEERWTPFAANQRIWLPKAMADPVFAAMFGKGPLEWDQADVAKARSEWGRCIQLAKKARDNEQRGLLQDSRRYLTKNLRDLARYQEQRAAQPEPSRTRASQQVRPTVTAAARRDDPPGSGNESAGEFSHPGVRAGVDELLKVPASLDALIALGSLSRLDIADPAAMERLEKQFGYSHGPAGKAGYRVMRELRARGTTGYEARELPRIKARLEEVKPVAIEAFKSEFSEVPTDPYAKRSLAQRYEKVMQQLKAALPDDEYQALATAARDERTAVVDRAVAEAKSLIDGVRPGVDGIAEIDRIVNEVSQRGLNNTQRRELLNHARARQREFANRVLLHAAEHELPALPESLAGIRELNAISQRMLRGIVQRADKPVIQQFVDTSEARLAEIGREALPEYEQALSRFPENEEGLAQAEREVADKSGWVDMQESVRNDYTKAAQRRRDDILRVVSKERERQAAAIERERKTALAAGGDPRLVGTEWVDTNQTMRFEFRDEETVFISALGIKAAGTYEVSRDDVVVKGPHGQLVYTLQGDRLTGMGATFIKQAD
jgi:hypothetical protein